MTCAWVVKRALEIAARSGYGAICGKGRNDDLLHLQYDDQNIFRTRWSDVQCTLEGSQRNRLHATGRVDIHDCNAAINIIPKGTLIFDPDPRHAGSRPRPNLYLPGRRRKFFLHAALRSGSCVVSVLDKGRALEFDYKGPPSVAADFL